jgi:dehydrogenase/reductase SDR family protein X
VDPGTVETKIMREVPSCLSGVAFIVLKLLGLLQSPEKGISSILDAALAPPVSLTQSNYSYLLELNADTLQ